MAGSGASLVRANAALAQAQKLSTTLPPTQKWVPSATGSAPIFVTKILEKYIFPEQFGAVCDGVTDDSAAWHAAFLASAASKKPIMFPPGKTVIDNVAIAGGASLRGMGTSNSIFVPKSGSTNPMLNMPAGQVQAFSMRDVGFNGFSDAGQTTPVNPGQPCMVFSAAVGTGGNGGIWTSEFTNIEIRGFDGNSIEFKGGASNFVTPHQWITFNKVQVERALGTSAFAFYASGQCEQFTFINCRFDCNGSGLYVNGSTAFGYNVYIGREFGSNAGAIADGTPTGSNAPDNFKFVSLVCQQASNGVLIDSAINMDFDMCRFEQLGNAMIWRNTAIGRVKGCMFNNAAQMGGTGTVIAVNSASRVAISDNYANGTTVNSVTTDSSGGGAYMSGRNNGFLGLETNVIPTLTITTGTNQLDMGISRGVYLLANVAGLTLTNIASDLSPGEDFFIYMQPGVANTITLASTGSYPTGLRLGVGNANITMSPGETHFFKRANIGTGWLYMGKQ